MYREYSPCIPAFRQNVHRNVQQVAYNPTPVNLKCMIGNKYSAKQEANCSAGIVSRLHIQLHSSQPMTDKRVTK